eukprot:866997-Pleurochrysis_carterae.AAC.2
MRDVAVVNAARQETVRALHFLSSSLSLLRSPPPPRAFPTATQAPSFHVAPCLPPYPLRVPPTCGRNADDTAGRDGLPMRALRAQCARA